MVMLKLDPRTEGALKQALELAERRQVFFRTPPLFLNHHILADEHGLVSLLLHVAPSSLDEVSRVRLKRQIHWALEEEFATETNDRRLRSVLDALIRLEEMKIADIGRLVRDAGLTAE